MIAGTQRTQYNPWGAFGRAYGSFDGKGAAADVSIDLFIDPRYLGIAAARSFSVTGTRDFVGIAAARSFVGRGTRDFTAISPARNFRTGSKP